MHLPDFDRFAGMCKNWVIFSTFDKSLNQELNFLVDFMFAIDYRNTTTQ